MNLKDSFEDLFTKYSKMSLLAFILSIICFPVGLVLAIISLCKKDGKDKHFAKIALIISGSFLFLYMIINSIVKMASKNNTIETTMPIETTIQTTLEETTVPTETTVDTKIDLVGGILGDYGKVIILNEKSDNPDLEYCYFVPIGKYILENKTGYRSQVDIIDSNSLKTNDDGYEEWSTITSSQIGATESIEIEIKEGQFLELDVGKNPDHFILIPIIETKDQDLSVLSDRFYNEIPTPSLTPTSEPTPVPEITENERTVYVSNTGKYHFKPNCSRMKHYTEMSLSEAKEHGYNACSKCT